ncbi:hypothetical protein [Paenibacillus sp. IHBB 3054]|uniref:hypothetical protein n=1 Tax=Paenibacillus sp. IHBB 3054 TaxID=3425689 RepID=UPI003F6747B1
MSYKKINEIEAYLRKQKDKTPNDIRFARTHLIILKDEIGEEEMINTKIYYEGQLASSPSISNLLATLAIAVSIFAGSLSIISSFGDAQDTYFRILALILLGISLCLLLIVSSLIKKVTEASKKCNTYTIIINLIDEVLKADSAKSKSKLSQHVIGETIASESFESRKKTRTIH